MKEVKAAVGLSNDTPIPLILTVYPPPSQFLCRTRLLLGEIPVAFEARGEPLWHSIANPSSRCIQLPITCPPDVDFVQSIGSKHSS
jgi:hypothetical protein